MGYSLVYDAHFDDATGKWLEKRCADPDCGYCQNRTKTAKGLKDGTNLAKTIRDIGNTQHRCPNWDYALISCEDPEWEACTCKEYQNG